MILKIVIISAVIQLCSSDVTVQQESSQCESPPSDKCENTTPMPMYQGNTQGEKEADNSINKRQTENPYQEGPCPRTGEPICRCRFNAEQPSQCYLQTCQPQEKLENCQSCEGPKNYYFSDNSQATSCEQSCPEQRCPCESQCSNNFERFYPQNTKPCEQNQWFSPEKYSEPTYACELNQPRYYPEQPSPEPYISYAPKEINRWCPDKYTEQPYIPRWCPENIPYGSIPTNLGSSENCGQPERYLPCESSIPHCCSKNLINSPEQIFLEHPPSSCLEQPCGPKILKPWEQPTYPCDTPCFSKLQSDSSPEEIPCGPKILKPWEQSTCPCDIPSNCPQTFLPGPCHEQPSCSCNIPPCSQKLMSGSCLEQTQPCEQPSCTCNIPPCLQKLVCGPCLEQPQTCEQPSCTCNIPPCSQKLMSGSCLEQTQLCEQPSCTCNIPPCPQKLVCGPCLEQPQPCEQPSCSCDIPPCCQQKFLSESSCGPQILKPSEQPACAQICPMCPPKLLSEPCLEQSQPWEQPSCSCNTPPCSQKLLSGHYLEQPQSCEQPICSCNIPTCCSQKLLSYLEQPKPCDQPSCSCNIPSCCPQILKPWEQPTCIGQSPYPCSECCSRIRPVVHEFIRYVPIIKNRVRQHQEFITREIPIVESHITQQEEQIVRHVPIVQKCIEPVFESRTRHIPVLRQKIRPVIEPFTVHVPVTESRIVPVNKCWVRQVPIFERRCIPVALQTCRRIPVTERRCRPIVESMLVHVPVKQKIIRGCYQRPVPFTTNPSNFCPSCEFSPPFPQCSQCQCFQ